MNFSRIRFLFLSLLSLFTTAVYAVEQLPEKEEDIPVEFIPTLDTTVSFGLHRLSKGPKVRFGNLGVIHQNPTTVDDHYPNEFVSHYYANGTVYKDGRTTYELDANGAAIAAGKTYTTGDWVSVIGNNGTVGTDGTITVFTAISTAEVTYDSSGNPTAIQNSDSTYIPNTTPTLIVNPDGSTTIADNNVPIWASTKRFLPYKDNQTRTWSVQNLSQINTTDHTVSMSSYGVESAGASVEADSSGSTGFELSLDRRLGKRGGFEWGISGGFQLIEINAKANYNFEAILDRTTDVYKMVSTGFNSAYYNGTATDSDGNAVSMSTSQPGNTSDLTLVDLQGKKLIQYVSSTSVATTTTGGDETSATPLYTSTGFDANGNKLNDPNAVRWGTSTPIGIAYIEGHYQLKGAYYLMHFGPSLRYRFNDRWSVSGNFGFALGYVGTVFRADEQFNSVDNVQDFNGNPAPTLLVDDAANASIYRSQEENTTHKFIPGYYGEINAEYWVTERTGFYFGLSRQTMRSFNQNKLSGRTAKIDMGSSSGWRIGIMTRF